MFSYLGSCIASEPFHNHTKGIREGWMNHAVFFIVDKINSLRRLNIPEFQETVSELLWLIVPGGLWKAILSCRLSLIVISFMRWPFAWSRFTMMAARIGKLGGLPKLYAMFSFIDLILLAFLLRNTVITYCLTGGLSWWMPSVGKLCRGWIL